jgi:arsenate reductase
VLFLCIGNACRSQIADGWAKRLKGDCVNAFSAGIAPAEEINSYAVKVMADAGVDISQQFPKHIESLRSVPFDYIVTLCDETRDACPVVPEHTGTIHAPFVDPTFMPGTEQEKIAAFIKLRDDIRNFVEKMPQILQQEGNKK